MAAWTILVAAVAASALVAVPVGGEAAAQQRPLSVDLARDRVPITTGFTGADLLLFGAVDKRSDIVAVVSSVEPVRQTVVHKERVFGIWLNRGSVEFSRVPVLYTISSTRPLADIAPAQVWRDNRIGFDNLSIQPNDAAAAPYLRGLIAAKEREGMYAVDTGKIAFRDDRLFRATLHFPAILPPGRYSVTILQLRDGKIVDGAIRTLFVSKAGLGAWLSDLAQQQGLLYGLFAIFVAAVAGLLGGYAFRR